MHTKNATKNEKNMFKYTTLYRMVLFLPPSCSMSFLFLCCIVVSVMKIKHKQNTQKRNQIIKNGKLFIQKGQNQRDTNANNVFCQPIAMVIKFFMTRIQLYLSSKHSLHLTCSL